jgi:hypothetical protein
MRALALGLVLGSSLVSAVPASAETVGLTAQAKAARAEFLLTATPPASAAAICLVDTGVTLNPDTPGVVDRIALEGDPSDLGQTGHGTRMAMYIGAPANGWGMVGVWPAARIVSVRANVLGQDSFTPAGYNFGLKQCDKDANHYGIKVALLALSSESQLTPDETEALNGTVAAARSHGLNVVVAAGNNDGRPPGVPASIPGAFSVAASNTGTGDRCPFSATGASLLAPGCSLDGADPATGQTTTADQGTSQAAALVAAGVAALRTWRPDLTPDEVDRLLRETATSSAEGGRLDLAAAFTAAGLGSLIPSAIVPSPTPTPQPPSPPPPPKRKKRLPSPKLSVRTQGHGAKRTITVRMSNRPRGASATVRVYANARGGRLKRAATRTRRSSAVRIRVRSWRRVTAFFVDPTGQRLASPVSVINAKR